MDSVLLRMQPLHACWPAAKFERYEFLCDEIDFAEEMYLQLLQDYKFLRANTGTARELRAARRDLTMQKHTLFELRREKKALFKDCLRRYNNA